MAEHANVSSIDSIDSFRSGLINYLSKSRPVLEDAIDDVHRTRQWVQNDRRLFWEAQVRRRRKVLEEAEQAVFSARLSSLREVSTAENAAVQRAKRAFTEAEEKLRIIKRWSLEFDQRVEPLVKQLEQLRTALGNTMPKAITHLAQIIRTLDAYANINVGAAPPPTLPPSESDSQAPAPSEAPSSPDQPSQT